MGAEWADDRGWVKKSNAGLSLEIHFTTPRPAYAIAVL